MNHHNNAMSKLTGTTTKRTFAIISLAGSLMAAAIALVLPIITSSGDGGSSSSSSPIITVAAQLRPNHTYMPANGVLNTGPPESLILSMPRSR